MKRSVPGARMSNGLTLVELMIVVALLAVILALAGPSFQRMIEMQRLRGTNAQVVTDLQLARSEAVARRAIVAVAFNANDTMTCYTVYQSPVLIGPCDCRLGPGAACVAPRVEVRTVQVLRSTGVTVTPPGAEQRFAFDPTTGGITSIPTDSAPVAIDQFLVDTALDNARKLRTVLNRAGRPLVCKPAGSTMSEPNCP